MDVCHANTACTAVESCSLVCACGDDSCISDNGKAANCSVNGDVIDFKSADCSVMVTVSQPRGVGYSAHRTNAVGLTERHSRAIRDLANSHKEVEISNCCNSCVRMVHTHAPKFSDVGDLGIELGRCSCSPSGIGVANDAKGPLHEGFPPGCMSGGCVKSEVLDGAKHNIPLVQGFLQFAPLSSLVHAVDVPVSANVEFGCDVHNVLFAFQSSMRQWGRNCKMLSLVAC